MRKSAIILLLFSTPSFSQHLSNPSFEGTPQMGIPPPSWKACNDYSTPDTQPGFWEINVPANQGTTYISLFTRGNGGFINDGYAEAIGTALLEPLEINTCYTFSADLAFFPKATFVGSFGEVVIYDSPVTVRFWGGNSECEKKVLLYESSPVTHEAWQTHHFTFSPETQLTYFILEAGYINDVKKFGCVLIDNIVIDSFSLDLGADQIVCAGSSVQLDAAIPDSNIQWSDGSVGPILTVNATGDYAVTVEKNGCTLSDEVKVQVLEGLHLELGNDTTICPRDTLFYDLNTVRGTYLWNTGSTSPSLKIVREGVYHVSVNNGCDEVQDEIKVTVDFTQCCSLDAPNIFTPNGDSLNDLFEVSSPSTLERYYLTIYNRWGSVVFESNELTNFWDGEIRTDEVAASGVYYWIATIGCTHKDVIFNDTYRGTLTLVR